MEIFLFIIFYLSLGYVVACLIERTVNEELTNNHFIFIQLFWPIYVVAIIILVILHNDFKSKTSKLRKWLRGF